jgi:pilus assembly protein Flp/PilA
MQGLRSQADVPPGQERFPDGPGATDTGSIQTMISTYEFLATWLRARFADDERGASLVEYALLVALIAVVCIVAIGFLGGNAKSQFENVGSSMN